MAILSPPAPQGFGQIAVRDYNRALILDLVRRSGPISRRELMRRSSLSRAAVFDIADTLREEGLVIEATATESGSGRTPMLLSINPDAGLVIGVEIGVGHSLVALFNLTGRIVARRDVDHSSISVKQVVADVSGAIQDLLASAPQNKSVHGVGVATSGLLDVEQGTVLYSPNLHWQDVPLKALLERQVHLPVTIENHAKAGALGEVWFGTLGDVQDLIFIYFDVGVGAGTIINGRLHWADRRGVPGFGHTVIQVDGPECSCGNRGCLERYASTEAACRLYRTRKGFGDDEKVTWSTLLACLREGDAEAEEVIREVGRYLGVGVTNLLNLFAPTHVVLGGHLGVAEPSLTEAVRHEVETRAYDRHADVEIVASSYGEAVCAAGVAARALEAVFGVV